MRVGSRKVFLGERWSSAQGRRLSIVAELCKSKNSVTLKGFASCYPIFYDLVMELDMNH